MKKREYVIRNNREFNEYLERIQAFAGTELGLMLTSPGDPWAA